MPAAGSARATTPFATGEPYLGLALDDLADRAGMRVSAVHAGPAALAGVQEGDRIVEVEGVPPDVASLQGLLAKLGPGVPLAFVVERNGVRLPLRVEIGDRGAWSGPARHASRAHATVVLPAAPQWQQAHATRLAAAMTSADEVAAGRLAAMLADVAEQAEGYNRSPWRDAVLADSAALAAWPEAAAQLASVPAASATWQPQFCRWLARPCGQVTAHRQAPDVATLATRLAAIAAQVEAAFAGWPGGRAALHGDVAVLLEASARGQVVQAQDEALRVIAAMQASLRVADADLIDAFTSLVALEPAALAWPAASRGAPPAALAARVQGDVLAWAALAEGFVVVGGDGANSYDMDGLYAVIDSGGDDTYRWSAALPLPLQLIDDRGGDDRYLAERGGPAAGLLGVAVLRDAGGDDHYESTLGGCGAGVFGFGLLIDAAGSDRYACARWSTGAGLYGGGALLDAGDAADLYLGELLVQGIGGPAGVGLLIDAGGDDFYRANGPVPSAYATPGVFLGLAQGVGYGLRPHDHGGLGVLRDLGGNDRYEAGE
ncbi:MAG: PDZ domain-containing protein [Gammaproteobacteria bacterium]